MIVVLRNLRFIEERKLVVKTSQGAVNLTDCEGMVPMNMPDECQVYI